MLISVLLPAAIAVIMCSLGLTLVPADFGRVLSAPRGVVIGMLNLAQSHGDDAELHDREAIAAQ